MNDDRQPFNPLQAQLVAAAFNAAGVEYLFLEGALPMNSYLTTTQSQGLPAFLRPLSGPRAACLQPAMPGHRVQFGQLRVSLTNSKSHGRMGDGSIPKETVP